jgi:predicted acetyltransferase
MHAPLESVSLSRITIDLGPAYVEMVDEFVAAGEGYPYNNIPLAREDMAAFIRELEEEEQGIGLPPGIVPQTTYVLLQDGRRVLGEIRFRPATEPPYRVGHDHIGYNVRPSERRRGYATFMLSRVLDQARSLGLPGVALTVEGENEPSVRTIQLQGGKLERREVDPESGESVALYWIPLQ